MVSQRLGCPQAPAQRQRISAEPSGTPGLGLEVSAPRSRAGTPRCTCWSPRSWLPAALLPALHPAALAKRGQAGTGSAEPSAEIYFLSARGTSCGFAAHGSRSAQSPRVSAVSTSLGCHSFAAEALRDSVPGAGDCPWDILDLWPCCCGLGASTASPHLESFAGHGAQAASAPRTKLVPEVRRHGGPGMVALGSTCPALFQPSAV